MEAKARPRLFRKRTREQKMRKMRMLEIMSAALAAVSAAIIFLFKSGKVDAGQLSFAGTLCVIIALYQVVNFYFGVTLQPKRANDIENAGELSSETSNLPHALLETGEKEFIELPSVTENTTELFRPLPHAVERDQYH